VWHEQPAGAALPAGVFSFSINRVENKLPDTVMAQFVNYKS